MCETTNNPFWEYEEKAIILPFSRSYDFPWLISEVPNSYALELNYHMD